MTGRWQLPTSSTASDFIERGLMIAPKTHRHYRWLCNIKANGRVCRNDHNGIRTVSKDARNMADHIIRHHPEEVTK